MCVKAFPSFGMANSETLRRQIVDPGNNGAMSCLSHHQKLFEGIKR